MQITVALSLPTLSRPLQPGKPFGFDVARAATIGRTGFDVAYFQEVFTTENWLVRVYELRKGHEMKGVGERQRRHEQRFAPSVPGRAGANSMADAALLARLGLRYSGCYRLEAAFAGDRVYTRGTVGTSLVEARAHAGLSYSTRARVRASPVYPFLDVAVRAGKPFLAVAHLNSREGHAYALSPPVFGPDVSNDAGCGKLCDDGKASCGCAEAACADLLPEPGQPNARR